MKKILFICTGNYYRSRFAEEYFNHLAEAGNLKFQAFSKGLSENMPNPQNPGAISKHALNALEQRNIVGSALTRFPQPLAEKDFDEYHHIIALSELEHRPMLERRFNRYTEKVRFFEVGDLPLEHPEAAMNKLAVLVEKLFDGISLMRQDSR
jgi:protein-tyrosine phosphatase